MMERGVEQVRHYLNAIPIGAGPQRAWEFCRCRSGMNTRNDFSVNYLISRYELEVPELRTLAIQRNRAVVEDPQATARVLLRRELLLRHSVIAGDDAVGRRSDGELADHVLSDRCHPVFNVSRTRRFQLLGHMRKRR